MKIYTKTGDSGDTSLFGGGRVRKSGLRVEAYGTVDELNSMLGLVRTYALPDPAPAWLETIQNDLFQVGADLATPPDAKTAYIVRVDSGPIEMLEQAIDRMEEQLPSLQNFILPGGVPAAATLHVARTICRRAERICVALNDEQTINPNVMTYLNRLSDFLFVLARWANWQAGESETRWSVRT